MKRTSRIMLVACVAGSLSLAGMACKSHKKDQPDADHPKKEHPKSDHPKSATQPSGEHPK